MGDAALHWIPAVVAVLTLLATVVTQLKTSSKLNGQVVEKIATNEQGVKELKDENVRQWQTIGEHGERLGKLEGWRESVKIR